ncbi:MAG: AAA family ATPase [Patescibacteria group bacterium]|nr:AAA family ATPase [Patescibacteria group bacterium]
MIDDNNLFVFVGKPGVGKSTLIKNIFPNDFVVDVLPFVLAYGNGNSSAVPEEKTILGYQDMYEKMRETYLKDKGQIILELGTSHTGYNLQELNKINDDYRVTIFLCVAPNEVCKERALKRSRDMDVVKLEARLERDFPDSYLNILENLKIDYYLIDTALNLEENILKIKQYVK